MTISLPKSNQTINIYHLQAVGSRHGPGQPEHLVLLAVLHNPSWLPSTGSRQGDLVDTEYLTCWDPRCSGWDTTCRDLWDNIHCWSRSLRCRRQGNSEGPKNQGLIRITQPWRIFDCCVRRKIVLEGDNFLSPKITAVFSQVSLSFCLLGSFLHTSHAIDPQRKEKSVLSIEMAFRRRYFSPIS